MSSSEPYWLFNLGPDGDPGTIRVIEDGPDGVPAELELFPIPLAALSLVASQQTLGLTIEELADASPEAQRQIMEAWFRANFQPGSFEDAAELSGETYNQVSAQIERTFWDPRTEQMFAGGEALIETLENEAMIWVQKPPEPLEARRQNALRALDELEAVIRRGGPILPGRDDNHPPEPLDDEPPSLYAGRREALVAVADSRRELQAEQPDLAVLRRSVQTFIKLARIARGLVVGAARAGWPLVAGGIAIVAGDAYSNGLDAAITHGADLGAALAHKALEAITALQKLLGGP